MVDWKRIPKIDAHIHLMSQDVIEANKGSTFADFGGVTDYLILMKRYNIEKAFLMPFNDPYMLSMDFKLETVHKNMRSICQESQSGIFAFADVDPYRNLMENIDELERIMDLEEFIGIKIHPTNAGYPVDGQYYAEIFRWAEKNNFPVEIHSYPRRHMKDDVCSPSRIIKVIEKFPSLVISIAHLGGFQYEVFKDYNIYLNISAVLNDFVKNVGIEKTNEILRMFNIDRLIFATDYPDNRFLKPDEIYERYFDILSKMDFTNKEAERICKWNVLEGLKLSKKLR